MTEPAISQIIGPHGPISTGSGPQNIYLSQGPPDSDEASPLRQAANDLRELAQCYVHPTGFGKARSTLREDRTVFLYGPAGNGKSAAAKLLLRELTTPDETIHQLLLQDRDRGKPFEFSHIVDSDHAWLDLTDTGGWSWSEIHREFPELRLAVHERNAYLVAILPEETKRFDTEISRFCVRIERPPLHEVLQRHLRMADFPASKSLEELKFTQQNGPLSDVPVYVQLISEAQERATGDSDFVKWCEIAWEALTVNEAKVRDFIAKRNGGPQRALLLTVAFLHGAHADIMDLAAASLLEKVKHPPDDSSPLERTPLEHRLCDIDAERDNAGNVRLKVLGFDSAIRSYFWTHMPSLRKPLQDWVETVLETKGIEQAERDNLVANFAGLCLTIRYSSILTDLVEKYTEQGTTTYTHAAKLILQYGLRAENCGRTFRRKIYDWSTSNNISDDREDMIVEACRQEIAATHPDEALVRLHHIARRKRGGEAHHALVALARADRRSLRQMLGRLTEPDPDARRWDADPGIFLGIADPEILTDPGERGSPLIAEKAVFSQLVAGWMLAFNSLGHETYALRVRGWLECAEGDDEHRHSLLDALVQGGAHSADVLASLYAMTCRAQFREAISDLVLEKITAAQGIELRDRSFTGRGES